MDLKKLLFGFMAWIEFFNFHILIYLMVYNLINSNYVNCLVNIFSAACCLIVIQLYLNMDKKPKLLIDDKDIMTTEEYLKSVRDRNGKSL